MSTEVPTVKVRVSASVQLAAGRWAWRPVTVIPSDAAEYVYSENELDRVFRAYGAVVAAVMLRKSSAHRFRLLAAGAFTGRLLGEYQWIWSAERGMYVPAAEPMIIWPPVWEIPAQVLRGARAHHVDPGPRAVQWADDQNLLGRRG